LNIVFFGTPLFAVPALKALVDSEHTVTAVVTQPDKQSGRGRNVKECPVKTEAIRRGLSVLQPARVRDADFIDKLKTLAPDVIVVVAYGQILPAAILDLPEYGCVNIHASLLPEYRGAAPINRAIIDGKKITGVTTMLMDEGMDTGAVLIKKEVVIENNDTAGTLSERLSRTGGDLLLITLKGLQDRTLKPVAQEGNATYVSLMKKTDGFIVWTDPADKIRDFIRGMNPWPGAYGFVGNERYKILMAETVPGEGEPGFIDTVTKDELHVCTGSGKISVTQIQPSGKPSMPVKAFLQGRRLKEGMNFEVRER